MPRHVAYVSGTRADYGPARRVLRAIHETSGLRLSVIATDMHLDPRHGETWREIEGDGLRVVERVYARLATDSLVAMSGSLGLMLYSFSAALDRINPDIVLVLGDRGEALAGAIAAAHLRIPVAHLCGGTTSGSIDDSIRHAITKFAHLHLVPFEAQRHRVIQMGEQPETVKVVGLPGGDLTHDVTMDREAICRRYDLPIEEPYLLLIQHPVSHTYDQAGAQVVETLEALRSVGHPVLMAHPNSDAGGDAIQRQLEAYAAKDQRLCLLPPPASREVFASIMAHAEVVVGNSSSAMVEAASVPTAAVNIGDRQAGREELGCALSVGYDRREIQTAIETALTSEEYAGDLRKTSERIAALPTPALVIESLKSLDLGVATRPKRFHSLDVQHREET